MLNRSIICLMFVFCAVQSMAEPFKPKENEIYQLSFSIPVGDGTEQAVAGEEMLVRVVQVGRTLRETIKVIVTDVVNRLGQAASSATTEVKSGLTKLYNKLTGKKSPNEPEVVTTEKYIDVYANTYILEVLYVYKDKESSWLKSFAKDKAKKISEEAKTAVSNVLRSLRDKMPKSTDSAFEKALRRLNPSDEKEMYKAGQIIRIDQDTLDEFLPKNQPPVKVGEWGAAVRAITALNERSLNIFENTTQKANTWTAKINANIVKGVEAAYKLAYALGQEIAKPGRDITAETLLAIANNVKMSDALGLFTGISGNFGDIMTPELKGGDFSKVIKASEIVLVPAADATAAAVEIAANSLLKDLGNKMGSIASSIASKFSSIQLPSIFRSEFNLSDLKKGVADIHAKLTALLPLGNKIAAEALNTLDSLKTELSRLSDSYQNSTQSLLTFLQIKRAFEAAKSIYDAESAAEAAIKTLTTTISNAQNSLTTQLKISFINGLKAGVLAKLSNQKLDLREIDALVTTMKKAIASGKAEVERGVATKTSADEKNELGLVKNLIGFATDASGTVQSAASAKDAMIRVMLRGFN